MIKNILVAGILAIVLVLAGVFFYSVPWAKPVATWAGISFVKLVVWVFEFVVLVFGLGLFGHFAVRNLVEYLDEKRASDISLQPWVHWLFNISLSIFFGWLWTSYVVDFVISIPGYVQTAFVNWGWYVDGIVAGRGLWWTLTSLMFFFGYFWRGLAKEFGNSN